MPLDQGTLDSVNNSNFKVVADGPAKYENLAHSNAVSHQQALNQIMTNSLAGWAAIQQAAVGKVVELLATSDVAEALGIVTIGQTAAKVSQTTPPISAPGPVT